MKKKIFKTVCTVHGNFKLCEKLGYFTQIKGLPVFIYHDDLYHRWYVIDLNTGISFANAESMGDAKCEAIDIFNRFKDYCKTEEYKNLTFQYQDLLKEE